jgi:DNA-directed RNA polymerase subunit RPC12/RpoP
MITCNRCGSTDIREHRRDSISVANQYMTTWYVACAECGSHVDYDDWLDAINDELLADSDESEIYDD